MFLIAALLIALAIWWDRDDPIKAAELAAYAELRIRVRGALVDGVATFYTGDQLDLHNQDLRKVLFDVVRDRVDIVFDPILCETND